MDRRSQRDDDVPPPPRPDAVAERLLALADELDALHSAGRRGVVHVRSSLPANDGPDASMTGLEDETRRPATGATSGRRTSVRGMLAGLAVTVALFVAFTVRLVAPARNVADASQVENAFLLRCLSPDEATELVRPIIRPRGSVSISPRASRVLTIHGTPDQIGRVRAVLDEYERAGSAACARQPAARDSVPLAALRSARAATPA